MNNAANNQGFRIEGEDAFYEGKSKTANPYDPSDDRHLSWNDGWMDAQNQDLMNEAWREDFFLSLIRSD